ncbi:MAG: LysR substrate-binding domain-containing protein [Gammaproteobacteria bacterium]|nr:LysR substrate-binding domain-containing protein [Gammaproteobacteria bacterium]
MVNLPTVKQLRYLIALEKYLHFGKAAEACFVTQSAFSVAIKELESTLNISLVDRTNRSVVFTSSGTLIAQQARLAIFDIEGIIDIAKSNQEPLCGQLKMGIIPTIAPFLLPRILPAIRKKYPKLELYLKEEQTTRIHQLLLDGELDIILLALPVDLISTESISIFNDPFKLAYRKGTKLIDPDNFSPNKLNKESILLLEDGHCLRDHAMSACNLSKKEKISRFSASSLYTLVQMVDSDLGITFVPQMAVDSGLLKQTKVLTSELKDKSFREIGLSWRKSSVRKKEFYLLADVIRQCVST